MHTSCMGSPFPLCHTSKLVSCILVFATTHPHPSPPQLATRVRECRATLTVLERINAGGEVNQLESEFQLQQLVGRMDLSRPIMAGHSFGGCSAIATMHQDARFK